MTVTQVVQVNREVLLANDLKTRVTQLNREVLLTRDPKFQTIQFVREVLKSINTGTFIGLQVDIAEFWFAPGVFMDFSNPANRAKFHDNDVSPVPLGNDGSTPTGSPPLLFLHQEHTDPDANDFTLNAAGAPVTLVTVDGHGVGYGLASDNPTGCPLIGPP